MQENIQKWIYLDEEIHKKHIELEELRNERGKIEDMIYQHVKTHQLINKQVKTTSGKRFVFRERTSFQSITQKFLRTALDSFFKSNSTPSAKTLFEYILERRMSKKIFEIEKK